MNILNPLRRKFIAAFVVLTLVPVFHASANPLEGMPSGDYEVDLTHASVLWKVSHLGFSTYIGRFNNFAADLALDTEKFSKSAVSVDIKVDSLDTDFPFPEEEDFNKKLSGTWFKSGDHPSITFVSKEVSDLQEGKNFTINGDLTLMGETKPVTLNAVLNGATPNHPFKKVPLIGFSATTEIDRTAWGLSNYAPNIGAQVSIEIEGEFVHKAK